MGLSIITDAVAEHYGVRRTKAARERDGCRSLDIYSVRAAFLSHLHADHVSGLPMFLQVAHLWQKRDESFRFQRGNRLQVYLPRMGIDVTREYLELIGLGQLSFDLDMRPLRLGRVYRDERVSVRAVHNAHRLGSSFSFVAGGEGRTFAYSGDTTLEDLRGLLREPVDLLVVECAHFQPRELFEVLNGGEVGKILIAHLHPELYGRSAEVEKMGRRKVHERVWVAHDGMQMEV